MDILKPDGVIYGFCSRFVSMVALSLCWLICSLPVVTMGAATAALNAVCLKMHAGDDPAPVKTSFAYFRSNLRSATAVWLIMLPVGALTAYSGYLCLTAEGLPAFLPAVTIIAGAAYLVCMTYLFACSARYENTPVQTIRNALFIGLRYMGRTLILAAVTLTVLFVCMWNGLTMILGIMTVPALLCYVNCSFIARIFGELEQTRS